MYTGSSAEQDFRFSDKEKKLLRQMKFSESLNAKVDINKVRLDIIKPWIGKRITEFLGTEDDVVEEFVNNQLEANTWPDPRKIQINLTGFLNGKNARIFMTELWELLLSAQESSSGIPPKLIEQKKEELKKEMEDKARVIDIIKKLTKNKENREKEQKKDRERKKSHSRSHSRDCCRRSRECHQEKKKKKLKDPDSKTVHEKHKKRDSRSKSKEKLVTNDHISRTKNEKLQSCSPKNNVPTNPKTFVSLAKGEVVETNTKLKPKERLLTRDFTKHEKKQHHSSSSSRSLSSSTSSLSFDCKKVSEVKKKNPGIKNKRQYRTNKDKSSDNESNRDKSTDRRDYRDRLSYRSRRLSRYAFNHGYYREKNRCHYYRDRAKGRERERNRHNLELERTERERVICQKDRERDRCRQSEREEKSSPQRRKSRSPERKSRSGSRSARSCSNSKRRPSGKSRSKERTVQNSNIISLTKKDDTLKLKDREHDRRRQSEREGKSSPRRRKSRSHERKSRSSCRRARSCSKSKMSQSRKSRSRERTDKYSSIISPTKKDNTSKLKASPESLSRTPSPFKKVGDKAKDEPAKYILNVINEQHSKSSQPQISKRQSPSSEKQNSNDKNNSSSSKPIPSTFPVIKKKEEEKIEKIQKPVNKSDDTENPRVKKKDESNNNEVKRDCSSNNVKDKNRKLVDSPSSEDDISKGKKKRKKKLSSSNSDESDRDEKKKKKDKKHKKHKKYKKHKKHKKHKTTEESDSDSILRDMLEQYLREKALRTVKNKNQIKHDNTGKSNSSE